MLYNHFADKEDLLAAALERHLRTTEDGLGDLPEPGKGTLEDNLRAHLAYGLALHRAILPAFTGLVGHPAVPARFAELRGEQPDWRDRLLDYLRAERELGRLANDAPVEAAAAMLVGVRHETVLSAMLGTTPPLRPPIEDLVAAALHGLSR